MDKTGNIEFPDGFQEIFDCYYDGDDPPNLHSPTSCRYVYRVCSSKEEPWTICTSGLRPRTIYTAEPDDSYEELFHLVLHSIATGSKQPSPFLHTSKNLHHVVAKYGRAGAIVVRIDLLMLAHQCGVRSPAIQCPRDVSSVLVRGEHFWDCSDLAEFPQMFLVSTDVPPCGDAATYDKARRFGRADEEIVLNVPVYPAAITVLGTVGRDPNSGENFLRKKNLPEFFEIPRYDTDDDNRKFDDDDYDSALRQQKIRERERQRERQRERERHVLIFVDNPDAEHNPRARHTICVRCCNERCGFGTVVSYYSSRTRTELVTCARALPAHVREWDCYDDFGDLVIGRVSLTIQEMVA